MFHTRSLLQFLQKTSLIGFLALSIIMLFHIFVMTLGTSLLLWHTDSTPFNIALITFLYYVIPLVALLSFNLIISQLIHIYDSLPRTTNSTAKSISNKSSKKSASRTVPDKSSKKSADRTVPDKSSKKSADRTVPDKSSKKSAGRTVPDKSSKKSINTASKKKN